jgi:hypothetical protein
MPTSKHRKNQKKKSKARTERVKSQQAAFNKKMQEEFMKEIEELKKKKLDIKEVESK